uniref:MMS1_N domain-containing protein n=1 Tax=Panagrellus redivivus TaxID=6233 RepID=A0A7E4VCI5_PANRE
MKQVTDDDNISEAEPEHRDIAPMDDNSEEGDVEMEESDGTVQSDVETDQLVSEGSSESSADESMEVDEPEEEPLAAPKAAKRRSRNPVDPWKAVNAVESFVNATLPAPHDVVVKTERSWFVQEFNVLTPNTLKQEVRGESYIAGLYNGIVVLQGSFEGVPLSSAFMSEAAVRPQVLYNDPTDPIKWMGGGRDHLVLLGDSGRLYLIGRAAEGQLGQDPSRHRYRTPTPINMRRRVLEEMEIGRNGKPKVRSTPEIQFDDVEAYGNVTIAWSKNLAFRCGTSDDGECSSTFKRYPQRDHDNSDATLRKNGIKKRREDDTIGPMAAVMVSTAVNTRRRMPSSSDVTQKERKKLNLKADESLICFREGRRRREGRRLMPGPLPSSTDKQ